MTLFTDNINIFGKNGEENHAKNMHGTAKMKNVAEVSCEEFPVLARACAAFFCVLRGILTGSHCQPQKWSILPRIAHSR